MKLRMQAKLACDIRTRPAQKKTGTFAPVLLKKAPEINQAGCAASGGEARQRPTTAGRLP